MAEAQTDRVVRALTDDNGFRVITLRATDTVRAVLAAQKATGRNAERCGELISGTILIRETMAPDLRVQAIVKGAGNSGSLVADAHPGGMTRGLLNLAKGSSEIAVGADALLQVVRTMPRGDFHQGVVQVSEGGINAALNSYMHNSEQVFSAVAVACVIEQGEVIAAGGYIVQLLPEIEKPGLAQMTDRLEQIRAVALALRENDADPDALLSEVLHGMPFSRVNESGIGFGCTCSVERVVSALASLGASDIEELSSGQQMLDVGCDYCGQRYQVAPIQLRALLAKS